MEEVIEEAIIEEVCTEDAIIVCLSVRNKCLSEETEAGRALCCSDDMEVGLDNRQSWSLADEAGRDDETERSEDERELMLLLGEERGLAKLKTSSESFTKERISSDELSLLKGSAMIWFILSITPSNCSTSLNIATCSTRRGLRQAAKVV